MPTFQPPFPPLIPTAVKTAAYTAAVYDLVPVDTSAASVTITLPTAPADKARIAVKMIAVSGSFVCTIALGGSDVFNKAGGGTTLTLSLVNQAAVLQYQATGAIWYVVSTDVPLGGLDARFAPATTGTSILKGNGTGGFSAVTPGIASTTVPAGNDARFQQTKDFTPNQIANLYLWIRASDMAGLADGATITPVDRSANAFALTLTDTPTKVTGVDGRVAMKFAFGSAPQAIVLPGGFSVSRQALSVYFVARQGNATQDNGLAAICDFGTGLQSMFWINSATLQFYNGSSNPATRKTQVSQEAFYVEGYRSSTTALTVRYNDWTQAIASPGAGTLTGGKIGSAASGTSFYFAGEISEVIIFNRALTDAEDAAVLAYLNRPVLRQQIICKGDSLTYGYTSAAASSTVKSVGYPWQLNRMIENAKVLNLGVVGQTLQTMATNVSTEVVPLIDTSNWPNGNIVLISAATNDCLASRTAAQIYADLTTFCAAVRAAGGKVIVDTMLSRGGFSGGQEAVRQTYNGLVRAGWPSIADGLADLDASTVLGGVGTYSNTTYFDTDQTHLTALGYRIKALNFSEAVARAVGKTVAAADSSVRHILVGGTAPTIAAGAGAGTSPTVTITGSDTAGQISIASGTLPTVNAVIATITYGGAYPTTTYPTIWPANAAAAALGFLPYVGGAAATFTISNGAALGLAGSTTYLYNYQVMGN